MHKITEKDFELLFLITGLWVQTATSLVVFTEDRSITSEYLRKELIKEGEIDETKDFLYGENFFNEFVHVVYDNEEYLETCLFIKDEGRVSVVYKM